MIDYVKFEYEGDSRDLEKNELLHFTDEISLKDGHLVGKYQKAIFHDAFEVRIYKSERVFIHGSLHKFKNKGRTNYDSFSEEELDRVLAALKVGLGLELEKCIIRSIEFGVNFVPPVSSSELLNGLVLYKTKRFKDIAVSLNGEYRKADLEHYWVKLYDKSAQYGLKKRRVRFELHYKRMSTLMLRDYQQLRILQKEMSGIC